MKLTLLHLSFFALEDGGNIARAFFLQQPMCAGIGAGHAQVCGLWRGHAVWGSNDLFQQLIVWCTVAIEPLLWRRLAW
jgi:hypothetical protein